MKIPAVAWKVWGALRAHWVWSTIGVFVIVAGVFFYVRSNQAPTYQFVSVVRGPITETVSVTGSTAPIKSVSLAFPSSGVIARVYRDVGANVSSGEVLATLDTRSLEANLADAVAAYNSADASRGATSAVDAATVARNAYQSAYTTLDTTLTEEVDTVFGEQTALGPAFLLTAPTFDFGQISRERSKIDTAMSDYRGALATLYVSDPLERLDQAVATTQSVATFLQTVGSIATDAGSNATTAQLNALATARTTVDTLLKTLAAAREAYRSSTTQSTSVADATVDSAAARVALARANLANASIRAPISGVITVNDAKVGQTATAGAPVISIISANAYEIEVRVPETDIGKISIGNKVDITFDAYPNDMFEGRVYYLDPAETIIDGVVSYKVKISLSKPDARVRSGLTANLSIATREKADALTLPQYAILEDDTGTFVETLVNGVVEKVPVTLGLQDAHGLVEVLSGVTEGQEVLNIGLKGS